MRRRRPYITTLAKVTINRSGESAVITYRDPAVHPVVFAIGPDIANPTLHLGHQLATAVLKHLLQLLVPARLR